MTCFSDKPWIRSRTRAVVGGLALLGFVGVGLCTGCAASYDASVTVIQPSFNYADHAIELVQIDAAAASTALAAASVEGGDVELQ